LQRVTTTLLPVEQELPMQNNPSLDKLCIDTIRTLSMDAVQKANSGHPGTPMALAPVVYHLWQNHLRYDPDEPLWPNRDRFVLSVGHASMLLYSALHLAGVKAVDENGKPTARAAVSLDDIKQFRQLDSNTPGHPEYRMTSGVETTTGPATASVWRWRRAGTRRISTSPMRRCSITASTRYAATVT
jgi:transketolase